MSEIKVRFFDENGNHEDLTYEQWIKEWEDSMRKKQEPLGKEFEQVLSDNLWDLMVKNG